MTQISAPFNTAVIEQLLNNVRNAGAYTLFDGATNYGSEYGWYGFRHANSAILIVMSYNWGFGVCVIKITDIDNGVLEYYLL